MGPPSSDRPRGTTVELSVPVRDGDLFKHGASEYVLNFLADNPDFELSVRQLSMLVPFSERATREAVNVLEANDVVRTTRRDTARLSRINRERLNKADDPITSIPQVEFHLPVRLATQAIESALDGVSGIVLFGSVARGTADRQSDVDIWVLVEEKATQQQHRATKLAGKLAEVDIPHTIDLSDAVNFQTEGVKAARTPDEPITFSFELEDVPETIALSAETVGEWRLAGDRLSGERYSFQIVVESPKSILRQIDRIDPTLFTDGITLSNSEHLTNVKAEVIDQ